VGVCLSAATVCLSRPSLSLLIRGASPTVCCNRHPADPHRPPQTSLPPQARGRTLLNLRLSDAEGGLLGRTLLTLVANKGFGGPTPTQLPPHKLSPHDVVAIRPNSQPAGAGGAPLVSGLVYRVRDTAVVVAVDEVPDEGLEQPLRVEKLANEVGAVGWGCVVRGGGGAKGFRLGLAVWVEEADKGWCC